MTDDRFTLSKELALKHLTLNVGEGEWEPAFKTLWQRCLKLYRGKQEPARRRLDEVLCFSIMLPSIDRYSIPEPCTNIILMCHKNYLFDTKDWVEEFRLRLIQDKHNADIRAKCLSLGIISPILYAPVTRQAFNWLWGKSLEKEGIDKKGEEAERIKKSWKKLIQAYGGTVVSSIFQKFNGNIDKHVLSWKNNYFFERLIHETFKPEELMQLKINELKKTNKSLIRTLDFAPDMKNKRIEDDDKKKETESTTW